ncbi:CDP-glucose 4,6-dehydratase [Sphingomonas lenta]|uniref:CDP-glucose 4,6-dehydratase n=1 Tax=Sphingomonas lenta TaxID=1141887 RepID=A0A2A2SB00_9SPHN|nr:CDP-glucose 4,6-dehydratase [Sphingomonas lenta]
MLVTGHSGFKGAWLALWLHRLGAEVTGLSLPPPTEPSLFDRSRLAELVDHVEGDIRDPAVVDAAVARARPEVVFHLAAQPIVRTSYLQPVETYATNVMGTVHLLDAARRLGGVRAFVCVTTDKCYENREWVWPYRESDSMGGFDPYSSSKGAAELAVAAYRRSFFPPDAMAGGGTGLASVRAGNVVGGGDWAVDRLLPDLVRAFERGEAPVIRNPGAVRPWQHVLEALGGYLLIAERLMAGDAEVSNAWNFGPLDEDARAVSWIVERMRERWGDAPMAIFEQVAGSPHEAHLLRLDCSKARAVLGWRPRLRLAEALDWIVDWHKRVGSGADARDVTLEQIASYRNRGRFA